MQRISNPLFHRLVVASGLASVIATPALRRALTRAGVDPDQLTPRVLLGALDSIEKSLTVYLPSDRVARHMAVVRALTRDASTQE